MRMLHGLRCLLGLRQLANYKKGEQMGFESLVDHARGRGLRKLFKGTGADVPLRVSVRQYEGSRHPRLAFSLSEDLAKALAWKHGQACDALFDRDDNTGLIRLRDDGYRLSKPETGKRLSLSMPFVPVVCPDFGENGYAPEEVDVKEEGLLFCFPQELFRTGRNGTVQA